MKYSHLCLSLSLLLLFLPQAQQALAKQPAKKTYTEADFSKAELDLSGLNESQKKLVLKLLNEHNCTCGCTKGSWANCIKTDSHCPFSRPMGRKVVQMVKQGKSEEFISGYFAGWREGTKRKREAQRQEDPNRIYPVSTMHAPVKGPAKAPVTIIEYTDYQCPFCRRVQDTLREIEAEYEGKIRLAVMNNPLSFHKNALPAALAARAAGRQGKFWEMHELLFKNQAKLDEDNLVKLAQKLGLDIKRFNADRRDEKLKREIRAEQVQAIRNNATGTPAFFINGKKLSGAKPIQHFRNAIEEALKRAKSKSN